MLLSLSAEVLVLFYTRGISETFGLEIRIVILWERMMIIRGLLKAITKSCKIAHDAALLLAKFHVCSPSNLLANSLTHP
jgi:hypothetical protein